MIMQRTTQVVMFMGVLVAMGVMAGCGLLDPQATVQPIYVTATFAATEPPSATETPVIQVATEGPTQVISTVTPNPLLAQISTLPTGTATARATQPATLTPSFTVTYTESPAPTGVAGLVAAGACLAQPAGGFNTIYTHDPALQASLGCPVSTSFAINSATEDFENGRMVWVSQLADVPAEVIYAVFNNGTYGRYDDTWIEGVDPESGGGTPPAGKVAPIRGFGKVWRVNPGVQGGLGWALTGEAATNGQIQRFERGEMLWVASLNQTFIFVGGASWRADGTPF
ncbi:MAG: hypothetical protein KF716_28640 [Anaerolineae bacterium]|nr:hypothetical protein [Anaerolineae bacterium]